MTVQEVKEYLEDMVTEGQCREDEVVARDDGEALQIAIAALEEIQKYREIGTVEELVRLKKSSFTKIQLADIAERLALLKKYEAVGSLEHCRYAVEKQDPICPKITKHYCSCPKCGGYRSIRQKHSFCQECGQAFKFPI